LIADHQLKLEGIQWHGAWGLGYVDRRTKKGDRRTENGDGRRENGELKLEKGKG